MNGTVCAYCVVEMSYWNLHGATLTRINRAVVEQPVDVQAICQEMQNGAEVEMNNRRMAMAVTLIGGNPACVYHTTQRVNMPSGM